MSGRGNTDPTAKATGSMMRTVHAVALASLLILAVGCTSDDGPDPSSSNEVTAETVEDSATPSSDDVAADPCAPSPIDRPAAWPYEIPDSMIATSFDVDDRDYSTVGVTDDAEAVLVEAIDVSFADYDVDEPTGGALDISVAFTSTTVEATLTMSDEDDDGCWDVAILATLLQPLDDDSEPNAPVESDAGESGTGEPDAGESATGQSETGEPGTVTTAPGASESPADTATDPLGDLPSVGTGQVTTARGTFNVDITACRFSPTEIDGQGEAGTLRILSSIDSSISVSWTYADDGVEVRDDDARVLAARGENGTYVADGENQEGPETIIAEVTC